MFSDIETNIKCWMYNDPMYHECQNPLRTTVLQRFDKVMTHNRSEVSSLWVYDKTIFHH